MAGLGIGTGETVIQGNRFFSTRKIKSSIYLPRDFGELTPRQIHQWSMHVKNNLLYEYEVEGFFDVSIAIDMKKDTSAVKQRWKSTIIIHEGERYSYGRVAITVSDSSPALYPEKKLRVVSGRVFKSELAIRDKRDIEKVYGDLGYAKRRVEYDYQFNDTLKQVQVNFKIIPGKLVVFDTLIVKNRRNKATEYSAGLSDINLIQSILDMRRGDTVRLSQTNLFKSKLKSTKVFSIVRLKDSLLQESQGRSAIVLRTVEKVPGKIGSSLFWETFDGFGGEAVLSHKNLLGKFYEGSIRARLAQRRQYINLFLGNPLLYGQRLRFDNELNLNWRQQTLAYLPSFDVLFSSSLSHPVREWANIIARLELEGKERMLDNERKINMNGLARLSLFFLDNKFNPSRGTRFELTYGNGGPFIDEHNSFQFTRLRHNWGELKSAYFFSLSKLWINALRLNFGSFTNTGSDNSIRFFLGGRNSIRSERFKSLCPEKIQVQRAGESVSTCNFDVTPVYFLTSYELRLSLLRNYITQTKGFWKTLKFLQVVPFTDYGKVWDFGKKINPEGEGMDIGLGLRIPITVFNFRLDYAIGWEDGPDWEKGKLLIDLAQAF